MTERLRFITEARRRVGSFTELCQHYEISRVTATSGSTAPATMGSISSLSCPAAPIPVPTPRPHRSWLLTARRRHPSWGPRKLLKVLRRRDRLARATQLAWPARSTVADLLRRHGFITPRRRRRFPGHPGRPLTPMTAPNGIWTADFKGQFKTGDGIYCYPLTVQDGFSRYLLTCRGLTGTTGAESRPVFERLFATTGCPRSCAPTTACPSPPKPYAGSPS